MISIFSPAGLICFLCICMATRFLFTVQVDGVNLAKRSHTPSNPVLSWLPDMSPFYNQLIILDEAKNHLDGSQMLKMKLVEWPIVSTCKHHFFPSNQSSSSILFPDGLCLNSVTSIRKESTVWYHDEHCTNLSPSSLVDINRATVFPFFGLPSAQIMITIIKIIIIIIVITILMVTVIIIILMIAKMKKVFDLLGTFCLARLELNRRQRSVPCF